MNLGITPQEISHFNRIKLIRQYVHVQLGCLVEEYGNDDLKCATYPTEPLIFKIYIISLEPTYIISFGIARAFESLSNTNGSIAVI